MEPCGEYIDPSSVDKANAALADINQRLQRLEWYILDTGKRNTWSRIPLETTQKEFYQLCTRVENHITGEEIKDEAQEAREKTFVKWDQVNITVNGLQLDPKAFVKAVQS